MTHDARAIANLILDGFDAAKYEISNKKINKLIYFCHGFSLVRLNSGLLRNHIEAWEHGPVVRVVYEQFCRFKYKPIEDRARFLDYGSGENQIVGYEKISLEERALVKKVVSYFIVYSADQLEEQTHRENSPWWVVVHKPPEDRGMRNRIPNELIAKEFSENYGLVGKFH